LVIVSAPSSSFHEDHVLRDGRRVTLRFLQPDDAEELRRAFARLSPRSRFQRFLGGMPELTDPMVAYLTQVDGEDHVAVVAGTDSHDLKSEVGLGVARFVRLADDPTVAEAAITVVDDAQGQGVGRLLLTALARLAVARGVRVFRGEVLAENTRMRHLLEEVGATLRGAADGQTLVFDVPIQEPLDALDPEKDPPHPLRRLLRAAAESLGMVARAADDAGGPLPLSPPRLPD
jgi:GNAT superfamily N-acetyltransferase